MKKTLLLTLLLAALPQAYAENRIAALSPDVADVVVALGSAKEIAGRDQTSTNPALKNTPEIGIHRQLGIEPILAVRPNLAIGSWMVQPASIYDQLNRVGVRAVNVAPDDSIAAYPESIRRIGRLIGKTREADALASRWQSGVGQQAANGKRYIVSYDGRLVAGRNTAADELIRRAGGINAAASVDGIKPLSREAWLAAKPDIVIISEHNRQMVGGEQAFAARPEIAPSPAAKNRNIHFWPANDIFRYGLDTPAVLQRLNRLGR